MKNISVLVLASIIAQSSIPVSGETAARSNLSQEKIEAMNELYKVSHVEEHLRSVLGRCLDCNCHIGNAITIQSGEGCGV